MDVLWVLASDQFLVAWGRIRDFIEIGGPVLLFIAGVTLVMWTLIIERLLYFGTAHRRAVGRALVHWGHRRETTSWYAHGIRDQLVSAVVQGLERNQNLIKSLVALCPLLGLLGTVTGMIQVFEVMATSGSGNPRSMAEGVSRATIPTMAGMVAALSGVFMSVYLQRRTLREAAHVKERLVLQNQAED